jgi:hypothetical protein
VHDYVHRQSGQPPSAAVVALGHLQAPASGLGACWLTGVLLPPPDTSAANYSCKAKPITRNRPSRAPRLEAKGAIFIQIT